MFAHEEIRTIISALGTGIGADDFDLERCRYGKIVLMTDADVDGAHIRTLLLTFFFRQMPELFHKNMVYVAQPPLYEIRVKGQKKAEYILSEGQMHKRMIARGVEGAELVIREGKQSRISRKSKTSGKTRTTKKTKKTGKITKEQLAALVKDLAEIERSILVLRRRGIKFRNFVQAYYNGTALPQFRIRAEGQEEIYYNKAKYEKRLDRLTGTGKAGSEEEEENIIAEELHRSCSNQSDKP
jgi:DNA gyrase subunit B